MPQRGPGLREDRKHAWTSGSFLLALVIQYIGFCYRAGKLQFIFQSHVDGAIWTVVYIQTGPLLIVTVPHLESWTSPQVVTVQ